MAVSDYELFEHAFRHAPIGMALVAPDGRWLKVNDALCNLVGYRRDELLAIDFQTITHADDLDSDLAEVARLLSGASDSYSMEKRYLRRDGSIVWALLSVSLVRDGAGQPELFISQIQDIDARKQAERSRDWFAAVVESSSDAIVGIDAAGAVFSWNGGAERMYGYRAAEMRGRHIATLGTDEATRAEITAVWQRAIAGAELQTYDASRVRRDGTALEIQVHVRHVRDVEGRTLGWSVTARDISERERLADALARQVESYAAIARSLPRGAVTVFDRELRVSGVAGELLSMLGLDPKQMVGRSMLDIAAPHYRDQAAQLLQGVLNGSAGELQVERNGVHLLMRAAPLHHGPSGVTAGLLMTLDVTAQRRQSLLLRSLAENMPNSAIAVFDRELKLTYVAGRKLFAATQRSAEQLDGQPLAELVGGDRAGHYRQVFDGQAIAEEQTRFGHVFELRASPIRDRLKHIVAGLVMIYDVTERRREAEELRRAQLLLDATISNMEEGVALLAANRRILVANEAYARIFGRGRAELVGLGSADLAALVGGRFDDVPRLVEHLLAAPGPDGLVGDFVSLQPRRRVLRRSVTPVGGGEGGGFLVVWRDVTKESDLIEQRDREALTDALTGIPNRRAAEAALQREWTRDGDTSAPLTVALFDIDHFKRVNDRHGHAMGDQVIRDVARVLASQARATDTVARWGGEEFIAILPVAAAGAAIFCERVRLAVRQLAWPGLPAVTLSAGLAERRGGGGSAELIQRADEKLYQAKRAGRDRVVS